MPTSGCREGPGPGGASRPFAGLVVVFALSALAPTAAFAATAPPRGAAISGRITDAAGSPVPDVHVTVVGTEHRTVTDDRGRYRLSGLAAGGRVLVVAERPGADSVSREIELDQGEVARLDLTLPAGPHPAQDRPVDVGQDQPLSLESLTEEDRFPLQLTGFAVGAYEYGGRTHDNSLTASKVAASLFKEVSDDIWVFGQLTTALEEGEEGGDAAGEVATSIEIDNLLVNVTVPGASQINFSFGKMDDPLGFERDDEPLNLQPSTSFNFELARPTKLVGLVGRWNLSPRVDVLAIVANGWNSQIDSNHGKTVGGRLGFRPTESSSIGLGGLIGPEGAQGQTTNRYLLTLDYAIQPTPDWIVGGEANYGGDEGAMEDGSDATWAGATLTVFRRLAQRFGVTARAEVFDDRDGMRTGEVQTLESFTISPVYLLGTGREGIFANVEHTTFRIPRFQVRGEIRVDRSNVDFFASSSGPDNWDIQYRMQLVTLF